MANGNNNVIDELLALSKLGNMDWETLSNSLLNIAEGYNPGGDIAGDHTIDIPYNADGRLSPARSYKVMGLGSNPLAGMIADMMYQSLTGKDVTQYDQARTAQFTDMGGTNVIGGRNVRPANVNDIVKLIKDMQ